MSTLFMSPKGGNCTTVTASAFSLMSAIRGTNTLLIDLCGDVPAAIGMAEPHGPGINDWLNEENIGDPQPSTSQPGKFYQRMRRATPPKGN